MRIDLLSISKDGTIILKDFLSTIVKETANNEKKNISGNRSC